MECSPPGSSVHGILQARILEWVGIPFSRGSPQPRDQTWDSCIAGRFFIIWATRETHDLSFYNTEFKRVFQFPLPPSSRASLVPLRFLPLEWYHLHIWGCWYTVYFNNAGIIQNSLKSPFDMGLKVYNLFYLLISCLVGANIHLLKLFYADPFGW